MSLCVALWPALMCSIFSFFVWVHPVFVQYHVSLFLCQLILSNTQLGLFHLLFSILQWLLCFSLHMTSVFLAMFCWGYHHITLGHTAVASASTPRLRGHGQHITLCHFLCVPRMRWMCDKTVHVEKNQTKQLRLKCTS